MTPFFKISTAFDVEGENSSWTSSPDVILTATRFAYIEDDSLVQQALFLGSHDKVVCVVPVVHNVLQVDPCNDDNAGVIMSKSSKVVQKKVIKVIFFNCWLASKSNLFAGWGAPSRLAELKFKRHTKDYFGAHWSQRQQNKAQFLVHPLPPVSSLRSRKNFWLKIKATPLISSTLASAVVFLLMKLAVMAMASFPRNSFLLKPAERQREQEREWNGETLD